MSSSLVSCEEKTPTYQGAGGGPGDTRVVRKHAHGGAVFALASTGSLAAELASIHIGLRLSRSGTALGDALCEKTSWLLLGRIPPNRCGRAAFCDSDRRRSIRVRSSACRRVRHTCRRCDRVSQNSRLALAEILCRARHRTVAKAARDMYRRHQPALGKNEGQDLVPQGCGRAIVVAPGR